MKQDKTNMITLPQHLIDYIWEFAPSHRDQLNDVMEELDDYFTVYCSNDMCQGEIHRNDAIFKTITIHDYRRHVQKYYYCCEHCASYGDWSARYDMRKYFRRTSG